MNIKVTGLSAGVLLILSTGAIAQSGSYVSIQYGAVQNVATTTTDSKHAGGALMGGLIGAAIGGPRHRGLRVVAGAAAGAAVQGAATGGDRLYIYTVELNGGNGSVQVTTEQDDIREGDCVSVEQGEYANIRRVSTIHCQRQTASAPPHHESVAKECDTAKQELASAETQDAVDIAAQYEDRRSGVFG